MITKGLRTVHLIMLDEDVQIGQLTGSHVEYLNFFGRVKLFN